jgi:peptidoglycan/LPS O-acetylase OafA/YrhL
MLRRVMEPNSGERARHWASFDGMRALAVISVMMFHADYPSFIHGGFVAIDIFFVLSGFLITWLLVAEHDRYGAVSYPKFYARRSLRLFPALGTLIVVVVILVLADGGLAPWRHETLVGVPFVMLYVGNYAIAFGNPLSLGLFSITWTLAIEEQFYLLWPLGLSALLKRMDRRRIATGLAIAAIAEQVVRFGLGLSDSNTVNAFADKSTFTHTDGLMLGAALALMWTCRQSWTWWTAFEKHADRIGLLSTVVLIGVLIGAQPWAHVVAVWITVEVYASVALVAALVARPDNLLSRIYGCRPLEWIGKRSYGLYLWHFTVFAVVATISLPQRHIHFTRFVVEFAATFVIATLSYRFIEQPFLNRKARFARVQPDATTTG